jgi:gamma-glutamylcysteine synthetase
MVSQFFRGIGPSAILVFLLFLGTFQATAQVNPDVGTYAGDYAKKINAAKTLSPLDENLFGDSIRIYLKIEI